MTEAVKKVKPKNRLSFFVLAGLGLALGLGVLYYYRQTLIDSTLMDESLLLTPGSSQKLGIRIDNKQKEKVSQFSENILAESEIEVGNPEPFFTNKEIHR